jgi:acetyl esterase/lipase
MRLLILLISAAIGFNTCYGKPPQAPPDFEVRQDVAYADTSNPKQTLDLYLPKAPSDHPRPLVIYIHGGGWEGGDKSDAFLGLLFPLVQDGAFAAASVNYRLTNEAKWPEQIYDCKAAVRWLRAHAKELNVDPDRFAAFGISAGGHLVSLLGTSGDVAELEGSLGGHAHTSSRVQAVIDFCGPADFLTLQGHDSIIKFESADSPTGKLFGKAIPEAKDQARSASPVTYISKDDPPFLIVHGTRDNLVPHEQATEFRDALLKAGVSATMLDGKGGGHVFVKPEVTRRERLFLERTLLGKTVTIPEDPVEISP